MLYVAIFLIPLFLMLIYASVKMVPQYQRGVVFRLGKVRVPKGPGVTIVLPMLEKIIRVDMRTITHDVPGQDIITKDNVSVRVSAVVYFRVIQHFIYSSSDMKLSFEWSQLSRTVRRNGIGYDPGNRNKMEK